MFSCGTVNHQYRLSDIQKQNKVRFIYINILFWRTAIDRQRNIINTITFILKKQFYLQTQWHSYLIRSGFDNKITLERVVLFIQHLVISAVLCIILNQIIIIQLYPSGKSILIVARLMNPNVVYIIISIHHVKGFFLQITLREICSISHHVISSSISTRSPQ